MTEVETEIVWEGAETLRPFLVPIASLEPWPGNPRRGDVAVIRESLREVGQKKISVVTNGSTIVAGHHVVLAAAEEGWTHVAALDGDFEDEEEARKFLLGDNRTAELGFIDEEALAAQLAALRSLTGTGYSQIDRTQLEERLAALRVERDGFRRMEGDDFQPDGSPPPRLDERSATSGTFEVPLLLSRDDRADFARLIGILKREWALEDTTAVVVRAVREAAAST